MGDTREHDSGENFLERWSRRKQAGEEVEEMSAPAPEVQPLAETGPEPEQELTDADMPPVDSLDADSDFSVFMSPGVSDQLRTLALRKLFHLPAFNVTDGLNDYDEDYTRHAGLGSIVTQEMRRMLKRELEAANKPPATEVAKELEPREDSAEDDSDIV